MSKKIIPVIYGLAVAFLAFVTVHMYTSADARFVADYGGLRLLAFAAIIVTILLGTGSSKKVLVVLTIMTLIADVTLSRFLFKGSLERFLYAKNEEMYHEAISEIVDKGLTRYVRFEDAKRKLYISYVYAERSGDDVAVTFSMGRPGVRSKIVYANSKASLRHFFGDQRRRFVALDQQWWIVRPD